MRWSSLAPVLFFALPGCTTYHYASNVKLLSFEDDVSQGKSVGPIRGEDCQIFILGYAIGGAPTLDKALAAARTQTRGGIDEAIGSGKKGTFNEGTLRYMNNVATDWDGFNAVVYGKNCLVVKGVGYK